MSCFPCICNKGYFGNALTHYQCVDCIKCQKQNREEIVPCTPDRDAQCGDCLGRTPSDGKSSTGLWPGELKRQILITPTPIQESERSCICVKRCIPIKTVSTLRISVWCTWHYFISVLLLTFDTVYTLVMC
jgi:hypothetical protein